MPDVLTPDQRKRNMSRIRGRNTKPEMIIRRGLHAQGLRYRLNTPKLPGRPDIIFSRHRAVIFVHGCFWHGHNCPMFKVPETRRQFWVDKITSNRNRDARVTSSLLQMGWRIATIWECSIRGPHKLCDQDILATIQTFLASKSTTLADISGQGTILR